MLSVGKICGDEELPLGANGHELQCLGPSLDHAGDGEGGGLAALVGAVKFGSVDESATVVDGDGVGGGGLGAGSGLKDFVLQAAGQGGDAGLGLVGCQELATLLLAVF